MHELSIVSSLVESVLNFVETHQAKRVVAVRLAIGELSCVEAEQVRFCYDLVSEGTAVAGSVLEIEQTKALVRCLHCDFHGAPNYWDGALSGTAIPTLQCPRCGHAAEAVEGSDCTIQSIKYVE
jgi:hydrogenase nickel incorporation protein HypA/HybF